MSCKFIYKGEEYTRDEIVQFVQEENLYVKGNYNKAKSWLEKTLDLTEDSDFQLIQGLMEEGSFGRFTEDGKILLGENFEQGTEYHEAFHRVFNVYLSEPQKEALRAEFRTRKDASKVLGQYKEKYANLSDNDVIEEILAEEFRDYVLADGKYTFPEKEKQGFFYRLFKFLKSIVDKLSNNLSTQENVYKKIQEGGFKKTNPVNYKGKLKERIIQFRFNNTDFTLSEKDTQNLMRGSLYSLLERLSERGMSFADIQNMNIDPMKFFTSDDYGPSLIRQLVQDIAKNLKAQGKDPRKSSIINFLVLSANKPAAFDKALARYLNSFKIKLTSNEDVEEVFNMNDGDPIEGDNPSKPENDYRASIEIDPYTSISTNIKLLLATIAKKDKSGNYILNDLGLKENEDPQLVFMILSQNLAGVPATPEEFSKVLRNLAPRYPFMNDIIQRVGLNNLDNLGVSEDDLNKLNFLNQFIQAFSKTRYTYFITFIDPEKGNIYSTDAQIENAQRKIRNEWRSNFNLNNKETLHTFRTRLNTVRNKDISEFSKLLDLGLTKEQLQDDKIKENLEYIRAQLVKLILPTKDTDTKQSIKKGILNEDGSFNYNLLTSFIDSKISPFDVSGAFENIAKNIALEGEYVNLQHFNTEGKMVYGISLNSFFTLSADKINYLLKDVKSYEEREKILSENFPYLFTSYSENSLVKELLFEGNTIKIGITDGSKNKEESEGSKTSDLKSPMRLSQILNDTLSGIYHFLQTGDRTTMNVFTIGDKKLFISPESYGKYSEGSYFWDNISTVFINYLKDEVNTYKKIRDNKTDYSYIDKNNDANILRFWKDILTKEEAKNLVNSPNLDGELQKPLYKQKLKQYLESLFEDYKSELKRSEVLTEHKNKVVGVSNEHINQYGTLDNVIMASLINQLVANIEQSKIFFGDFVGYKNITDIYKRLSQFNSTRKVSINSNVNNTFIAESNLMNPIKIDGKEVTYKWTEDEVNTIHEVVLKDGNTSLTESDLKELETLILESFKNDFSNIKDAEKAAKNFVNHYTKFEEADGQSYVNIYFYRAMMIKSGAWEKEDEVIFKKIINNEQITAREIIRLSIQKPNYLGPISDSTFTLANRKTSYFPLIPQLIKGTNLEKLNNKMIQDKIDVIHLDSAGKFGTKGVNGELKSFYNQDGSINLDFDNIINELSWDYLGVQLDMNKKAKEQITEASQARKNLLHNLFDAGIPRDYKGKKDWNTLTVLEKLQESDLARLSYEYNQTMNDYINESYEDLKEEIGLKQTGKNTFQITNWKAFKELLYDEALERGSSDVVLEGINLFIKDNGEVNYINTLSNKNKIEQILMSIVTNRIVRQKRFGDSLPQGSIKGLEATEHRTKSGNTYYSSDVLSFHKPNKEGGVTLAEFAVPLPDDMIKTVNRIKEGNSFEDKLKIFNDNLNDYVDESVRRFHGLRIPNQQYSSNTAGVIKFYLPPTANTIIVPSAFVKQTGSDFDIDKLFVYFKKYKKNKDGKFVEVKYYEKYKELVKERKELQEYIKTKGRASEEDAKTEGVFDPEFKSKLSRYKTLKSIEEGFEAPTDRKKEYLHNKLIDLSIDLLTHKENVRQLLNPVDDKLLNDEDGEGLTQLFLKSMGSVDKNGKTVMPDKKLSITDVFNPLVSHTKFKDFFAGVVGIGQVARHIPNHAFTQLKNLKVSENTLFNDHNGLISKIRDINGNWITEILSMFLTSQVDIGKNPYARYLGITRRTLNIVTYLVRRGADYREVLAFMQQPIIQKYIQFMEINESEFIKQTGRGKLNEKGEITGAGLELNNADIVKRTMAFFNIDYNEELAKQFFVKGKFQHQAFLSSKAFSKHNLNELLTGLSIYKGDLDLKESKKLNNSEKAYQLRILAEFLDYTEQSKKFENFIRIANPDTSKEKDLVEVKQVLKDIDTVRKEEFIENFEEIWENNNDPFSSLLNPYNKARYVKDAYSVLDYIYSNPLIEESINIIVDKVTPKFTSKEDKEKIVKAATSDFISRQIVRWLENKYGINVVNSLKGNNSVARNVKRIKKDKENPLNENLFIQSLVTLLDNVTLNDKNYDNFQTYDKKATVDRINLLTAEIQEIRKHNLPLFEQLYYSNFAQSGVHNSPFQISQFLPTSDYFNIVQSALKENLIDREEIDTFFEKFILNRPNLIQKQTELELEISAMNPFFDNTPDIYSIWNKSKGFWDIVVKGIGTLSPVGNGFNLFDYTGNKKTNIQLVKETKEIPTQEVINSGIGKTIAIIGTAGRSQVPTLQEWNNMLSDARNRVKPNDILISGGAAFADHIAVKLFLEGRVKSLKLRLPAKIVNNKFEGGYGTAGGTANYYHDKFSKLIGVNTVAEIQQAIDKGAEVTYETEISNKAMFIRNDKVAKESDSMIAYTYGEGVEPTDGGTKDTWNKAKYSDKVHVPISKIKPQEQIDVKQDVKEGIDFVFEQSPELDNAVYSKLLTNSGISAENLLSLLLKDNLIEKQCS